MSYVLDLITLFEDARFALSAEIANLPLKDAIDYANSEFMKYQGKSVYDVIPNFDRNYERARNLAGYGRTYRREMPVIRSYQVKLFQFRLQNGYIDVNPPYSKDAQDWIRRYGNPFPEGLTGEQAERFLEDGLPIHDGGQKTDDSVQCFETTVSAGDLRPIQKQIYLDKCLGAIARGGVENTRNFLVGENKNLICSTDNYIIDGHHRWLSAILIDPSIRLHVLSVDLPIKKLLPLALSYGDATGNRRNG